ncbi:MAG TPA: hypothetical protein VII91_01165 [Bauldia sp.]
MTGLTSVIDLTLFAKFSIMAAFVAGYVARHFFHHHKRPSPGTAYLPSTLAAPARPDTALRHKVISDGGPKL